MGQLVIPFREVRLPRFRAVGLIAQVWMWVCEDVRRQDDLNAYHKLQFRFDTGATHTSMSLATARENNLTVPPATVSTPTLTATGWQTEVVHEGVILAKFVGLEAYPFVWPCLFHAGRPADVPPLLGLNAIHPNVGRRVRYVFEGASAATPFHGRLLIEVPD